MTHFFVSGDAKVVVVSVTLRAVIGEHSNHRLPCLAVALHAHALRSWNTFDTVA